MRVVYNSDVNDVTNTCFLTLTLVTPVFKGRSTPDDDTFLDTPEDEEIPSNSLSESDLDNIIDAIDNEAP